jgi:cell division GTPase FtsZ
MKNSFTQKIGDEIVYNKPVIKVIGLGGGGGNAVSRMISRNFTALRQNCSSVRELPVEWVAVEIRKSEN